MKMDEIKLTEMMAEKAENKPKTLEELFVNQFLELQESHGIMAQEWLKEKQKTGDLQSIVDTLKKHVTFDYGTVSIFISESQKKDRDFIVEALGLKEEEKPNE
jgi:hypothetical protein